MERTLYGSSRFPVLTCSATILRHQGNNGSFTYIARIKSVFRYDLGKSIYRAAQRMHFSFSAAADSRAASQPGVGRFRPSSSLASFRMTFLWVINVPNAIFGSLLLSVSHNNDHSSRCQ